MICCKILNPGVITYVLSLAFQIAGAVLLIIKYWGRTRERIIDEYFPGSNIIGRDDENNAHLEKRKVQKCARIIYHNRMAFLFIAIGYGLSVFGETSGVCRWCLALYVALCTIILILFERAISIVISKVFYREDIVLPYSEIEDIADTVITSSEIDAMFAKIYNKK